MKSINNIFESLQAPKNEQQKFKCARSYLPGDWLQWWELPRINNAVNIITFEHFSEELLKYFEPVKREANTRKPMNIRQNMVGLSKTYN